MAEMSPSMQPVDFDPFADGTGTVTLALTEPQREMYAAAQMGAEASCAYNQCLVLRLRGPLSLQSMECALAQVIERHEALRLRITSDGETQEILDSVDIALPLVNLSAMPEPELSAAIARLLDQETHTPFDLAAAPLWRAQLVRERADCHRLIFTAHHLICDGWSSAVIFADLAGAYASDRFGMPAKLASAASYREFVEAGESAPIVAETKAAEEFWERQYASGVPSFELPLDYPRPQRKTYAAARASLRIDESLYLAVQKMAAQQGCTLFMTLLAAFEALIARLSGNEEFVIGVPMASQALQENGHLVAHGVNTIPLRCQANLQHSFSEHLRASRKTFLDAQAHQRLTFGSLVQRLKVPRDPSRTPLVNVLFNIDRLGAPFDFGELVLDGIEAPKAYVNFELSINAIDSGRDLLLECDYNADLYSASTVARWLGHYRELLAAAVADPTVCVAVLPLVSAAELKAQAVGINAAGVLVDASKLDQRVDELISAQVRRTPQAIAAVCGSQSLTYLELERHSDRAAARLRSLGVAGGSLVGIHLERSLEMLVAVVAVMKAGGAYVPLDPQYPAERLAYMVSDAGLPLVITESSLMSSTPPGDYRRVEIEQLIAGSSEEPAAEISPHGLNSDNQLIYVLYTSGSTGRPKGVALEHRNVVNLLLSMQQEPGMTAQDCLVAVTTLSFDIAALEFYLPLISGATVVIASRDEAADGNSLRALVENHQASVLQATPATWRLLLESGWQGSASFKVLCGGEALPQDLARQLAQRSGQLWNMYGPTETAIWSTCFRVIDSDAPILIGRPIANTRIYVLDRSNRPVPTGVPGEIYIAGAGVARGYLHKPELTAERFVRDPFSNALGSRMYRTGDVGRYLEDGNLEFRNRIDSQVKIRGFRVELSEVEMAMASHSGVKQAIAKIVEIGAGDVRLVGYFLAHGSASTAHDLRDHLKTRLPHYMVPQHYVRLDAIPLLPNGKVNREALPTPTDGAVTHDAGAAPQTDAEVAIAEIWQRLLSVERVNVTDNFFDLGGHSMLATRAINEIYKQLGLRISFPRIVYESLGQLSNSHDGTANRTQDESAPKARLLGSLLAQLRRAPKEKGKQSTS